MTTVVDRLEQLDDDEFDALIELAQARANSQMSKRDFLKAAGVLGAGAAIGGGGAAALTQNAQAAASTTDADGDVGTPANPVDVFADALSVYDGANNRIGGFDETGIDTPSVDTERLTNTVESAINMATPQTGIVESQGYHQQETFDSLDGWEQSTSGSGTVSLAHQSVSLSTGSTDGSHARFNNNRISDEDLGWDADMAFTAHIEFFDTAETLAAAAGGYRENDKSFEHIGFAMKNGDLVGTVGDGSTETTATIVSGASAGREAIWCILRDGVAEFYRGGGVDGTPDATITSNLPSGTRNFDRHEFLAQNASSSGSDRQMEVFRASRGVAP